MCFSSFSDPSCRYGFLLNWPGLCNEESGNLRVDQRSLSKTTQGDVITFESWKTLHCNPLPKRGETRRVIFWYSFVESEVFGGVDADFQLNPWTLYHLVNADYSNSLVCFFFSLFCCFIFFLQEGALFFAAWAAYKPYPYFSSAEELLKEHNAIIMVCTHFFF